MNAFEFSCQSIDGTEVHFSNFKGKTLLVVNTASKGQCKNELLQLQMIQNKFSDNDFLVLAFPCRQFLKQESKSIEKIHHRYIEKARLSFPVFSLTKVNGTNAHPFFKWMKQQSIKSSGNSIEWNFTKFLILGDGVTVKRFSPTVSSEKVSKEIDAAIQYQKSLKINHDTTADQIETEDNHDIIRINSE